MDNQLSRLKVIMRTSVIGIIANAVMAGMKMVVGAISGSIAIVLDGVNNLSDAASSLITILGAALAGKPADRKHPFGYGRMEYLSSLIISAIVLYAGITSMIESVKKIITPEASDYSAITLIILVIAVIFKLLLALYTQRMGRVTKSDALVASGKEAILDVLVSVATLVAAFIFILTGLSLEAWLGAVIAVIIIKAGVELLLETVSKILGQSAEVELAIAIKKTASEHPYVHGAYDLVMNNYGPEFYMASIHVEVDENLTAAEIDKMIRDITDTVLKEHSVYLSAISVYAKNKSDKVKLEMEEKINGIALSEKYVIATHGFYVDFEKKIMRFDLVVSLDAPDRKKVYNDTILKIKELYPDFEYAVGFDLDFNELTE